MAKGKIDEAILRTEKEPRKVNSPINEAEKNFVKAMALCMKGDVEGAYRLVQKALVQGIPIERIAAGPREILEPLYVHPEFKMLLENKCFPLIHGPMVGSVTDSSASIWVRTRNELKVKIFAEPISGKGKKQTSEIITSKKEDFTGIIQFSNLEPDTKYKYRIEVDDQPIELAAEFTTFPKANDSAKFKIVFGGGAGYTLEHERMWNTIQSNDPDALLLLGDNVYIDDPKFTVTDRYCYYRRHSQADWKNLISATPVYTIYDDHDFGLNDCNPGPHIERPPWKRKTWEIFKQNWVNPYYGGGTKQPGCWYDFYIGDVHFIMLDCRYYRHLKGGSMLGPVQKEWLYQTLAASKGTFIVLTSSVPWTPGVKNNSKDTWDGFPAEREEIFSFIESKKIEGIVLMAADRHRTDMRKIPRPNGYDFYEVMSSRLTNVHTHGLAENAQGSEFIMGYNKKCSFGLLEFDTEKKDPEVKFSMISIDNENIDSRTLVRSQLSYK